MSRTFSIQGRLRQLVAGISILLVVVMLSALALLITTATMPECCIM